MWQSATTAARDESAQSRSLPQVLLSIVQQRGRPLTVKEILEALVVSNFPTTSSNFPKRVRNKVDALVKKGLLRRTDTDKGMAVSLPKTASRATPTPPANTRKKPAGTNGQAASHGSPSALAPCEGKLSLRALLTRCWREANAP